MNSEEFIKSIKQVVHDNIISNLIGNLENPAGRKPSKSTLELSEYISKLSENEKFSLQKVINRATHSAIFNFLTVLDGALAIENPPEKGELKLYWENGKEKILLNAPEGEDLHDIYQAEVYSEIFENET